MFNFFKKLFSKKDRLREQLKNEVLTTQTFIVAKKQPFYHEMIGQADGSRLVRIYNRKTSELVEESIFPDKQTAMQASLDLLNKHNKGVS